MAQSDQHPVPTPKHGLHPKKILISVWWTLKGVAYWELLPDGQTITADIYCEQIDRLATKLRGHWPKLAKRIDVIMQYDNARQHTAKKTRKKLKNWAGKFCPTLPIAQI